MKLNLEGCDQLRQDMQNGLLSMRDCMKIEMLREGFTSLLSSREMQWTRSKLCSDDIQKLLRWNKLDPLSTSLDLSDIPHLVLDDLKFLLEKLPQVRELNLENVDPSFYEYLPSLTKRLKKVTIPVDRFKKALNFFGTLRSNLQTRKSLILISKKELDFIFAKGLLSFSINLDVSFVLEEMTIHFTDKRLTLTWNKCALD